MATIFFQYRESPMHIAIGGASSNDYCAKDGVVLQKKGKKNANARGGLEPSWYRREVKHHAKERKHQATKSYISGDDGNHHCHRPETHPVRLESTRFHGLESWQANQRVDRTEREPFFPLRQPKPAARSAVAPKNVALGCIDQRPILQNRSSMIEKRSCLLMPNLGCLPSRRLIEHLHSKRRKKLAAAPEFLQHGEICPGGRLRHFQE